MLFLAGFRTATARHVSTQAHLQRWGQDAYINSASVGRPRPCRSRGPVRPEVGLYRQQSRGLTIPSDACGSFGGTRRSSIAPRARRPASVGLREVRSDACAGLDSTMQARQPSSHSDYGARAGRIERSAQRRLRPDFDEGRATFVSRGQESDLIKGAGTTQIAAATPLPEPFPTGGSDRPRGDSATDSEFQQGDGASTITCAIAALVTSTFGRRDSSRKGAPPGSRARST